MNLRKTLFFSLVGHLTAFGMFSFTFNASSIRSDFVPLSFLGRILPSLDQTTVSVVKETPDTKAVLAKPVFINDLKPQGGTFDMVSEVIKPQVSFSLEKEKPTYLAKAAPASIPSRPAESSIMFHPLLPYQLQLYFKDRQAVHIELQFNITSKKDKSYIEVKRRISSGNLEADLLSARYISHYLFIQQAEFARDNWQTVKIDLSALK